MDLIPHMLPTYHALPTELLARIFKIGAHMLAHREELPFPLLVSSINRHWRNVVINSPDVWSNVQCLLIPHIDRCHRFIIEASDYRDLLELIRPLRDVFTPRLEYIEIHLMEEEWADNLTQQHFLTGGTPDLRSVRLRNVCLQYSPTLAGVQTLDLHKWQPSWNNFRLLAAASSLTKLVLRECTVMNEDEGEYPVIEIPSLLSLAISHTKSPPPYSAELYQSLLKYLSLPNLEYLEIVHATVPDLIDHFPIDHQKLNYPKLQTLRLDSLQLAKSNMEDLLPLALPTVSHLQLINTEGECILPTRRISTHEAASATAATTESPRARWPNLHTITLGTAFEDDLNWLCGTVSNRIEMGKPLRRVRLLDASCARLSGFDKAWFEVQVEVDVVGEDEILGIIRQEDENQEKSELDRSSASQGDTTSTATSAPSHPAIMASYPNWHQPTASTSAMLFPTDFIHSVASSLDEFDTSVFIPDGDINFERDFGQWFHPEDIGTITADHSDVHQPTASTSTAADLLPNDFQVMQSSASSLIESDPPIFRPDDDIDFEREFGHWFHSEDRDATMANHPDVHQPTASTPTASDMFPNDTVQAVASSLIESYLSIFRSDGDISSEEDWAVVPS